MKVSEQQQIHDRLTSEGVTPSSKLSTLDSQLSTFNYKLLSTLNTQLSTPLVLTLAYMWLLFILSSVPGSGEGGRLMDLVSPTVANVLHVPAYGLLALLWIFTLRDYGASEHRSMWVAFVAASGYGALTELQQFWVPGRYPSVLDVLSNIAGSLLFIALYRQGNMRFRISNFGLRVVSAVRPKGSPSRPSVERLRIYPKKSRNSRVGLGRSQF